MSRHASRRITRFRTFTRYGPAGSLLTAGLSRWAWLLAFLLSPSTAHALTRWLAR